MVDIFRQQIYDLEYALDEKERENEN